MKTRFSLIAAFCLLCPTVALHAQGEAPAFTDEEDARVATIAARQSAVTESLTAGDRFQSAGENVKAAGEWNRAGRFQLKLNNPQEAIATFQRALDVLALSPDPRTRVDSLNGLARAYERASKIENATTHVKQALALSEKINYVEGKAEALLVLPYCLADKLAALNKAQESLQLWTSIKNKLGMAQAYLVVGEHQIIQNNVIEAANNYELAQKLWQELNVPNQVAEALISLGFVEWRKGAWQASLAFYIQAQQLIVEEAAEPYMMGQIKAGLAEAFLESGMEETGLDKYREALEYYRQTNYAVPVIGIQWGIGAAHYFLGNYTEALANLRTTRVEALGIPDVRLGAMCDDFLGRTYYELKNYPDALQHYQLAYQGFVESGSPMEATRTLALIGRVYQEQGNLRTAKSNYLKALASFEKLSDQVNEAATLYALGTLEMEQNNLDQAEAYLGKSIRLTETMRRVSSNVDLTAAFSSKVHDRYEKYIDCQMRKYQASRTERLAIAAFEMSELSRARSLTELLHATQANLFPGLDPELAYQEQKLRGYLRLNENAKLALLSGEYKTDQLKALEAAHQDLQIKHDQIIQEIRTINPRYEQVIQPSAWDLSMVQDRILTDDDTVLLEYSLGSERSYLWAITRSGIKSYSLPGEEQIYNLAVHVYSLLKQTPDGNTDCELAIASEELANVVLYPAREHLNRRRVIVISDGILNCIPFQILPSPVDKEPLIASTEIINAPSASILGQLQQEAKSRPTPNNFLAAFGNPVFSETVSQTNEKTASEQTVVATARLRSALREMKLNGEAFDPTVVPRLFHAKRELDTLRKLAGDSSLIVSDYNATRDRFLNTDLSHFAILHLVTHAYYIQDHPENSGFLLSNINNDRKQLPNFVGLREIYELRAPVLLVVLSACQTALGENLRGEGLMGLTRGFMHAGASSVVASLWEVDDRATAELMQLFYSNMLERGMKTSEALRAAQNSIRQRPEWRSPHYWAAFTLQGESQIVKPRTDTTRVLSYAKIYVPAIGLLLIALTWWLGRLRKLRKVT
jgi:CHAT domain-containing protein